MFLTVAGSSCSGKTTVARACAEMNGLVVHDFDEIGVPAGADTAWRQRSLENWIRRALRYQADGLDVLLTGQSPLGEVLACPSAIELNGIAACLLDVDDQVRWRRLEDRGPGRWDEEDKRSFIGWARWHRGHAAEPGGGGGGQQPRRERLEINESDSDYMRHRLPSEANEETSRLVLNDR